jgi:hypothetical protein
MKHELRRWIVIAALLFFFGSIAENPAIAAAKQTLTGEVGDAMCGAKHMEGTPAECTRTCVSHGSKYALVVGEKVYVLNTTDKAVLAVLDQQAGKKATIIGTINGTAIDVSNAVAAK